MRFVYFADDNCKIKTTTKDEFLKLNQAGVAFATKHSFKGKF